MVKGETETSQERKLCYNRPSSYDDHMPVGNPSWKKGDPSPNPAGRPKNSLSVDARLMGLLRTIPKDATQDYLESLLQVLLREGLKGDRVLIQYIINRIGGMPKQPFEHGSDPDNPVRHEVNWGKHADPRPPSGV